MIYGGVYLFQIFEQFISSADATNKYSKDLIEFRNNQKYDIRMHKIVFFTSRGNVTILLL